ncbi:hypothetical protein [Ensifer canadensis]
MKDLEAEGAVRRVHGGGDPRGARHRHPDY